VIIGKNSRIFLQRLRPSKASTVRELQRGLRCGLGAFRTIRPMLLSAHVMMMMGSGRGRRLMMMTIGVFLANARTVCFAHGGHCCVGAEQRHCKNNCRQFTMQHNFYDTPRRNVYATGDFDRPKHSDLDLNPSASCPVAFSDDKP